MQNHSVMTCVLASWGTFLQQQQFVSDLNMLQLHFPLTVLLRLLFPAKRVKYIVVFHAKMFTGLFFFAQSCNCHLREG